MTESKKIPLAGKAVIFVDGDKGGVGKSWTSCLFLDYLGKKGIPVAAVDGDTRNPDVSRMFSDSMPVLNANLRIHTGWMDMTDFLVAHPDKVIVVSMPAGIGDALRKEAKAVSQTLGMLERPLAMLWVMNRQADSVNLLNEAMQVIGGSLATKIAVKNLFFGDEDTFHRWDGSDTKKRFEKSGGVTITLSELHERTVDKLLSDNENIMPFSQAAMPVKDAAHSPHGLTPSENMELVGWLHDNHGTFDRLVAPMFPL